MSEPVRFTRAYLEADRKEAWNSFRESEKQRIALEAENARLRLALERIETAANDGDDTECKALADEALREPVDSKPSPANHEVVSVLVLPVDPEADARIDALVAAQPKRKSQ